MIVINYSHPLVPEQIEQITALAREAVESVIDVPTQLDADVPFAEQVVALADQVGLSSEEWQTLPLLVNPPSYNFCAVALLAHLEGLIGHLPAALRLRPVPDSPVRRFEVAEIIDLASIRDAARLRRRE